MRSARRATSRGSTSTPTRQHRVTVLATKDDQGNDIADIDGSTWDPWAQRLLFTTENANAPTYSATPGFPSQVHDVSGALGRGGYEGIQNDSDGNIWIVEDIGGATSHRRDRVRPRRSRTASSTATCRRSPGDLANGKLQVLQVAERREQADHAGVADAAASPTRSRCTPTAAASTRSGSRSTTRPSTAPRRSTPTRSRRRRTARRSSGPRTASSCRTRSSRRSSSTRPATRTRPARRTPAAAAGRASSS